MTRWAWQPLYYSARGQTIYFGSHLSLLAKLIPGLDLDESYIAEFLLRGECLGERTIYRDVRRLGVGRTMRYRPSGGTELQTWWLGDVPELRYRDPRDYEEHFRQLAAVGGGHRGRRADLVGTVRGAGLLEHRVHGASPGRGGFRDRFDYLSDVDHGRRVSLDQDRSARRNSCAGI